MKKDLEKVLNEKIKPIIALSTSKHIGGEISRLNEDITEKVRKLGVNLHIDLNVPFKEAKRDFKKEFLTSMIRKNCGNISEVARIVDIDRRSIHRLVNEHAIKAIREERPKMYDLKYTEVYGLIDEAISDYKDRISIKKLQNLYDDLPHLTDDIISCLPGEGISLKEAEREFEKEYIEKALDFCGRDLNKTANFMDIAHETLHRKIKVFGIA